MVSHKVKVSIFGLVTTSQVFVPFAHAVHDGINNDGKIINAAGELLLHGMNDFSEELGLKWVAGEFNSVDSNSEFNITTFSVLKEKPDALYFSQNRLSKTEDSSTLNIGAGVYKLLDASGLMPSYLADRNVVVGANVFLDVQSGTNSLFNILGPGVHKRYSVGGTLKTSGIDINANIYRAITNELDGYNITNGWDYGIDGVIPGLEQVKLGASAYNFTGTNEVLKGRKFNIEYKPNSMFTFGTMYDDVNDSNLDTQSVYAKITYTFNAPTDEQLQLKSFEPSTVWDKRYDEVKRENTIRMEKIASIPEIVIGDSVSTIDIRGNDTTDIVIKLSQALSAGQEVTLNAESSQPRYIGFVVNSGDNMGSTDSSDDENTSPVAETKLVFTSDNWESGFTLKLESLRAMEADAPTKATITLKVSSNNTATDFANMLEKELTVNILPVSGQSDGVVAVDQPEIAPWGTDIQLTGVTGGGTGAITYAVTNDFDSIGATVDNAGLVSGTTKSGAVVVTVSRAADNKYLASSKEVIVVFGKSDADVTVATPPVVMWGTDVQISGVSGGGTGAITYAVTNDLASIGATVDNAGLVSGTTKSGVIVVTVSRAGDANYEASSVDVIVVFDKSDADVTVTTPGAVMWGNDIQIPLATGGGTGAITYTVKTDSDLIGATVDNAGLVSGATKAGAIVVTVSRAGDDNFEASSVDVIVTFNKSDSDVTVVTPASVVWETNVQISGISGGGTGAITYTVKTDSDSIGATVDGSGLVSGATKAGSVIITVSRAGDTNFEASSVDVTVVFDKSDADVTVATPTAVVWGNNVQIPTAIGGGTGAITYAVKTDADSIGAMVDGSGLVSGATEAGSVVITVSRAADDNYEASSVDVIVTFNKSDADVTVGTPTAVAWGNNVQISDVIGGGTGAITYAVKDDFDSIGATVDNTGLVSGATKAGAIVVTVSRAGDDDFEASSVDVIVAFDKSDEDVTVGTPAAIIWGNDIQIPLATGGGTGAITYTVKTDSDSIGATVDNAGLVSGATKAGAIVVTVSRAADANYTASSADVIVTFDKSDADVTVVTPASVAWDTNVQISGVSGGGTGAITYTVTDADSVGATVDGSGLVSGATKAGSVVITVSRTGDANFEASSVDVTVVFGKSDADVTVVTPASVAWDTNAQISGVSGGGTGTITYTVKTDSDSIGATVDSSGLVSGATKAGSVVITVSRATDANYEASSVDVTVVFDKSDADITVATPTAVVWGNNVQIPTAIGGGTGAITYAVKTDADSIGATVDGSGLVSGATEAGSVVITVSRVADDNYEASSVDVIVTFNKSDADVTVATPTAVAWGNDIQISGVIGGGTGAITYAVKNDSDSIGATVDNAGLVSGATKAGAIVVTVSRAGDDNFEASSVDVIVVFDKSDADVTVATPTAVVWGNNVQISDVIGGGTGAITYVVKTDADSIGATVDGSTGLVSGATKAGSVTITVSRAGDANYNASSADVIVTFDKSNIGFIVAQPGSVSWGTDVQISGVIGGGTGAITYVVKTDADSIGATVDGSTGLVSGATKVGSVIITVSRAADANYNASSADVIVTFDKSDADVTVATPTAAAWDTNVQISGVSGGGTGAITYTVTDADSVGATVDGSGLVSGATKAGSIVITVSRTGDANFEASSVDVTVVFGKSDADVTVVTPASVAWETNVQISGVSGGGTGAITYTVKTDSDSIGATVDGSGLVSGATKAGSVTITVSRAGDANFEASSVDVTVVFDKSDADVTVATPAAVVWGNNVQIPTAIGGGTGAITYIVKTDADSIGAMVDGSGLVSGATEAGSVVITVSRAADDNYEASSVDVIVTFNKSDADVTVATPTAVAWGNDIQISGVIGGGTGAITYAVKDDFDSIGATVDNTGLVSGATKAGAIVVTVNRAGDDNFEASSVDVIVVFDKSDADVTVATPTAVVWGNNVQISDVIGGGTGAITYVVKTDADSIGATVDGSTGLVSGATKAGSVTITVSRAGDANYNASSVDVIVTFDKSDIGFIVAQPGSVSWGNDVQISGVSGGGTGAITYTVTDADSIGATVDGSGLVSGATKAGSVVITVSRAADANYNASSADVIVAFDKSDIGFIVAQPGSVSWGNDVQISGVSGGGTGAITYTVTDADSIGATVDGSTGLVSGATKAGSVVITVSRAADANYNAFSADVIVTFDKSDADVTVATPTSVIWGNDIQIPAAIGGGTGAITYIVTDADSVGATVDGAGLVSGAIKSGSVTVTVNRATDANYEASSADVIVTFDRKVGTLTVATPPVNIWSSPSNKTGTSAAIALSGNLSGLGNGTVTYVVDPTGTTAINGRVGLNDGIVSANSAGDVVVTVTRAADDYYTEADASVTISLTKAILSQMTWSIEYDLNSGVYHENGETGEIFIKGTGRLSTYAEFNLDTGKTTATGNIVVDLRTGVISGVTGPGDVYLNVTAEENPLYEVNPSPIEVIRIFNASTPAVTAATPSATVLGNNVQISGVTGGGGGTISYTVKDDTGSTGASVDSSTGLVSGATNAGTVIITVNRAADANYETSSADVDVTFITN